VSLIASHARRRRARLAVSYGAMALSNTFELLYPFALGLAVDGLLAGQPGGVLPFVVISLLHLALGLGQQWHDSRLFNELYASVATELVGRQREAGTPTTLVAARAALAWEYVDFLRNGVSALITVAFAVVGSLVMLFFYDLQLGVVAALVAVPVALLNRRLMRRSQRIHRQANDESEVEVSVIREGTPPRVKQHFGLLAGYWNRLSDAEAATWGLTDLMALGLTVFALVRATAVHDDVGTIFAVISYVFAYVGGLGQVPWVLQQVSSLADIRRRMDEIAAPAQP
jgi:ABC-type multidrug transport system fused ATPase/permease subunit